MLRASDSREAQRSDLLCPLKQAPWLIPCDFIVNDCQFTVSGIRKDKQRRQHFNTTKSKQHYRDAVHSGE